MHHGHLAPVFDVLLLRPNPWNRFGPLAATLEVLKLPWQARYTSQPTRMQPTACTRSLPGHRAPLPL